MLPDLQWVNHNRFWLLVGLSEPFFQPFDALFTPADGLDNRRRWLPVLEGADEVLELASFHSELFDLGPFNALAQTNATQASTVGTWKADLAKTSSGADPAPKAMTLTFLKDTLELTSWRVDEVDAKGESMSYSLSGPLDGSLQPVKDSKGQVLFQESLTRDKEGALLRHGVDSTDGSSFDGRATLSADGNTITDVITSKTKDGKTSKETTVYRRVTAGK